jgi:hypothetical protein
VGVGIGYALGSIAAGDDEASLRDSVVELRKNSQPALNGLELLTTEYPQGVRGGRVVARTEYGAAKADLRRARDVVAVNAEDLQALGPRRLAALNRTLDRLTEAVGGLEDEARVDRLAKQASDQLLAILPGSAR